MTKPKGKPKRAATASGYKPKRSSKRWLEGAPDSVVAVYDDRKSRDRFTVIFGGEHVIYRQGEARTYANAHVPYLALGETPSHPQGHSMWGEFSAYACVMFRSRSSHDKIRWLDLPENVRKHVEARLRSPNP